MIKARRLWPALCYLVVTALAGGCKQNEPEAAGFSGVARIRVVDSITGDDVDSHLHIGFVYPSGSYATIDGSRALLIHNTKKPSEGAATILTYKYAPFVIPRSTFQPFDGMRIDHEKLDEVIIKLVPKANPESVLEE